MEVPYTDHVFRVCDGMVIPSPSLIGTGGIVKLTPKAGGYVVPQLPVGVYTSTSGTKRIEYLVCFSPRRCGVDRLTTDSYLITDRSPTVSVMKKGVFYLRQSKWSNCLFNKEISRYLYHSIINTADVEIRNNPVMMVRYLMTRCGQQRRSDHTPLIEGDWSQPVGNSGTISFESVMKSYIQKSPPKGQCFTYSALMNALLRQVGIQSRQVVGTSAGHPSQTGMIEMSIFGESSGGRGFWNFHCWNEAFVNGEWHFLDATPQCRSSESPFNTWYISGPYSLGSKGSHYDPQLVSACIGRKIATIVEHKPTKMVVLCNVKKNVTTGRVVMVYEESEWVDHTALYDTVGTQISVRYPPRVVPNLKLEGLKVIALSGEKDFVMYAVDVPNLNVYPIRSGTMISKSFTGYIVGGIKTSGCRYLDKWYSLQV